MSPGRKRLRPLSPSEWEIMKIVWDGGKMAARDIYERLPEEQGWSYATAKTLIRRLIDKGWLKYRQVGNSYLYRAAVGRRVAVRMACKDFSARVLDGFLSPLVAYMAEREHMTPEDLDRLEEILRRHKRE